MVRITVVVVSLRVTGNGERINLNQNQSNRERCEMYRIVLDNGKCSCSWEYALDKEDNIAEFETELEAYAFMVDGNYEGVVI